MGVSKNSETLLQTSSSRALLAETPKIDHAIDRNSHTRSSGSRILKLLQTTGCSQGPGNSACIPQGPVRVPLWNQGPTAAYSVIFGTKFHTGTLAGPSEYEQIEAQAIISCRVAPDITRDDLLVSNSVLDRKWSRGVVTMYGDEMA